MLEQFTAGTQQVTTVGLSPIQCQFWAENLGKLPTERALVVIFVTMFCDTGCCCASLAALP